MIHLKKNYNITNILLKRSYNTITNVYNDINLLSKKEQTSINLNSLVTFGNINSKQNILYASQYLHNELPIRLAHRIKDLDSLPYDLYKNNYINNIREWYITSFYDMRNFKYPENFDDSVEMVDVADKIYNRHAPTLITMANGIQTLKNENIDINIDEIQGFLNKFYMSRIGIRVLLNHYIETFKNNYNNNFGIININCSPYNIINNDIDDINFICTHNNIETPNIDINHNDIVFPYISSHLYYILFEILKNSVKANYEFNKDKIDIPNIKINIKNDNNWIVIKISDEGGGISNECEKNIWNYFYTTSDHVIDSIEDDFSKNSPLSGFGYGLPITKLYLKYFGGYINICSNHGHGTDVYILLRIKGDFNEPLL